MSAPGIAEFENLPEWDGAPTGHPELDDSEGSTAARPGPFLTFAAIGLALAGCLALAVLAVI